MVRVVLGSQSPRRRELLAGILGAGGFRVVLPTLPAEPDFTGCSTLPEIDARLQMIARLKHHDISTQLAARGEGDCIVTADTIIVGQHAGGDWEVCGKPPDDPQQAAVTVRNWFRDLYAGRRHLAKTGVCVGPPGFPPRERIVTTAIWFRADALDYLDWYLATGEPAGKAGGYAMQGAGSLFCERIEGSLSNIVGLPLVETWELLRLAGVVFVTAGGATQS